MKICKHNDGLGRCGVSGERCTEGPCDCEELIEYEPVRHGRWISPKNPKGYAQMLCSKCMRSADWEYKYCPNCGAKMDGDTE